MKNPLLLFLVLLTSFSYGQSIVWEKKYDNGQIHVVINKTTDSSLIVSGCTNYMGNYPSHIIKYDWNGNIIWQKAGVVLRSGEEDIIQDKNGGYFFTSTKPTFAPPPNTSDIFIQKLSQTGDTVWMKIYPTIQEDEYSNKLIQLESGDLINLGTLFESTRAYYSLRRTDSLGNTIWSKKYAKSLNSLSSDLLINQKGNLLLSGSVTTSLISPVYFHPYLIEVNKSGDSIRSKDVIVRNSDEQAFIGRFFNNTIQTLDGGYAFSGYIDSSQYQIGFIVKLDSTLEKEWVFFDQPKFNSNKFSFKVIQMGDSSFLLLSQQEQSFGPTIILTRLKSSGEFISKQTLQTSWCRNITFYDWAFLPDSSVVIVGRCNDSPYKAYMVKVGGVGIPATPPAPLPPDTLTTALPQLPHQAKATLGQSYPNPANTEATIPYTLPAGIGAATILIHDLVRGTRLQEYRLEAKSGKGLVKINLQNLSSGIYLYTLVVDGRQVKTEKMVVIK